MLVPMHQQMVWKNPAALRDVFAANEDISITMSFHIQLQLYRKKRANTTYMNRTNCYRHRNTPSPTVDTSLLFLSCLVEFCQECRLRRSRLLSRWIMAVGIAMAMVCPLESPESEHRISGCFTMFIPRCSWYFLQCFLVFIAI